jgi:hypothetical protein
MLLVRHGGAFFITYLLAGIGLLIAIATPFNEAVGESLKWSATPIILLSIAFTRRYMRRIRQLSNRSSVSIWLYTLLTAAILSIMSWPYALLINASIGQSTSTEVGGTVQEKFVSKSRSTSFVLVTWSKQLNREIRLTVPEATYASTRLGSNYTECFYVGSLGFFYRWRYTDSHPTCGGQRGAA